MCLGGRGRRIVSLRQAGAAEELCLKNRDQERQRRKEKEFENGLTEDQKEKRKKDVWIQRQWESCWKIDRSEQGATKWKAYLQ